MLLARRLTLTAETPATLPTAFSTWAEQAEQVMPVTEKVCFIDSTSFHEFLQDPHQLVDHLVVALADVLRHAGAQVLA